jgi:hypothetical protein
MGFIGDLSALIAVGGIGYLVYDYSERKCASFIGKFDPSCVVSTATGIVKGTWEDVKNIFR